MFHLEYQNNCSIGQLCQNNVLEKLRSEFTLKSSIIANYKFLKISEFHDGPYVTKETHTQCNSQTPKDKVVKRKVVGVEKKVAPFTGFWSLSRGFFTI